jgi:hypothetical protein
VADTNLERFKVELAELITQAKVMIADLLDQQQYEAALRTRKKGVAPGSGAFQVKYQTWYSQASEIVLQLLPARATEFRQLYEVDPKRKSFDLETFVIQDWMLDRRAGTNFDGSRYFVSNDPRN